jgi:hypothetical protein
VNVDVPRRTLRARPAAVVVFGVVVVVVVVFVAAGVEEHPKAEKPVHRAYLVSRQRGLVV